MVNSLFCEHLAHICLAGGVTDKTCTAAEERDRLVSCELHALHKAESHEMTYMQAVRGGVKTDIECRLTVIDEIGYLLFICKLREKSAALEFFKYCHFAVPFFLFIVSYTAF